MLLQICTLFFIAIFIGISQAAGVGGGAIINVLLIAGMKYDAKSSVPITYIFLMGGGLASLFASLRKMSAGGPKLVDYDLVMITLPMMMSGAIFGTIINHLISEFIITLLFVTLIVFLIYSTGQKLRQARKTENPAALLPPNHMRELKSQESLQQNARLEEILAAQRNWIPKDKLKIVAQIYVYTIILLLCRGGKNYDSFIGLERCGIGAWVCAVLHLVLSYLYSKSIAMIKSQADLEKESLGYVFADQGERMSDGKMREGMFNGFLAGVLGGCVSIGGGMVLLPLWIRAGLDRNLAAGSTGPLIFFSSSVSFFISMLLGTYKSFWEVLLFFVISFIGSYLIKGFVAQIADKYNFKQMIFVLLMIVMLLSLFALLPFQYYKYSQDPEGFMAFDVFC